MGIAVIVLLCFLVVKLSGDVGDKDHRHKYAKEVVKEATCTEEGEAKYTCIGCKDTFVSVIPARGHKMRGLGDQTGKLVQAECEYCGKKINTYTYGDTGVSFTAPARTRGHTAAVTITNSRGFEYDYVVYDQKADYNSYTKYINLHGCSACCLTTVLKAAVPELDGYTPDRVIKEVIPEVTGQRPYNPASGGGGKPPVTLYAMTKIFDEYGVKYKLPDPDPEKQVQEVTEHLRAGDPVILTMGSGKNLGLSRSVHTILLLGIDKDGHVVVGDSTRKNAKRFGENGLVKPGMFTVEGLLKCIQSSDWSVMSNKYGSSGNYFYKGRRDRGYIMITCDPENIDDN